MLRTLFALTVGAGLAFLLDPDGGHRRRTLAQQRLASALHQARKRSERRRKYLQGVMQGRSQEHAHLIPPDNPDPDDLTLRDRVESEMFRHSPVLKGEINIDVIDGVVELRGMLLKQEEIDELIARVRVVRDVKDVRSYLHLPGEAAPNKIPGNA